MGVCPYYFLLMRAASSATPAHVPLTAISRGGMIESLHSGSIAVVDRAGNLLYAAGDPEACKADAEGMKHRPSEQREEHQDRPGDQGRADRHRAAMRRRRAPS